MDLLMIEACKRSGKSKLISGKLAVLLTGTPEKLN